MCPGRGKGASRGGAPLLTGVLISLGESSRVIAAFSVICHHILRLVVVISRKKGYIRALWQDMDRLWMREGR